MPQQTNRYETARKEMIYQLGYLITQIAAMPLPTEPNISEKDWLMQEAWIMEESVWDAVENTVEEMSLLSR